MRSPHEKIEAVYYGEVLTEAIAEGEDIFTADTPLYLSDIEEFNDLVDEACGDDVINAGNVDNVTCFGADNVVVR